MSRVHSDDIHNNISDRRQPMSKKAEKGMRKRKRIVEANCAARQRERSLFGLDERQYLASINSPQLPTTRKGTTDAP